MTNKLGYRDGGKTSEEGINRITSRLLSNAGILGDDHMEVTEAGSPDNTVVVAVGDISIGDNSPSNTAPAYYYHGWADAAHSETVSANASGNARIDVLVAFVDLTVTDTTNSDNPGALDFMIVAGTAAATPVPPTTAEIQTAVGASNPWIALAQIDAANGFSSITDSDITDLRPRAYTPDYLADKGMADHVAAGLLWSQDTGLVGQMTSGLAVIGGKIITKGYLTKTFNASKDTYVDLPNTADPDSTDDLTYTAVANDATAPALASGSIRLAKVVTGGSAISSVTTSGVDGNDVPIRQSDGTVEHDHTNAAKGGALGGDALADTDGLLRTVKIYTYDGTDILIDGVSQANGANNISYAKPAGLKFLVVECAGGGGAGAGTPATGSGSTSAGPGGSSGSYARSKIAAGDLSSSETVTIGAGGTGSSGATGNNGEDSSLGSHVIAKGGRGGSLPSASPSTQGIYNDGTAGVAGSTGQLTFAGGPGAGSQTDWENNNKAMSGSGGNSRFGGGAISVRANASGANAPSESYGGGGSGSAVSASQTAKAGGNGTSGILILYEYF